MRFFVLTQVMHDGIIIVVAKTRQKMAEVIKLNIERLKKKIAEKDTTIEVVAKAASMDRSTFYRKMQPDNKGFTVSEAKAIALALEMSGDEANAIFYS